MKRFPETNSSPNQIGDLEFSVTQFRSYRDGRPRLRTLTVAELAEEIRAQRADLKERLPLIGCYALCEYRSDSGSPRRNENVAEVTAIPIDYDDGKVNFDEVVTMLREHGIGGIVYTTPSFTPEKPRWRIIAPLSRPHNPADHHMLVGYLNGLLGDIAAKESYALSQSYHFGAVISAEAFFRVEVIEGETLDTNMARASAKEAAGLAGIVEQQVSAPTSRMAIRQLEKYLGNQVDWRQVYLAGADLAALESERPDLYSRLMADIALTPKLKTRWEGHRDDLHDRSRSGMDRSLVLILRAMGYSITDALTIAAAWGETSHLGAGLSPVDKQGRDVDRERQMVRLWLTDEDSVPISVNDLPIADAASADPAQPSDLEFPSACLLLPSVLMELVDFLDRASPTRVPRGLLVAAALTAVAFFAQNRFIAGSDSLSTPIQLYSLLVGRTGVGKSRLAKLIFELTKGTRLQTKVVDELASGPALYKKMEKSVEGSPCGPTVMLFFDEAGLKLKRRFEKSGGGHMAEQVNAVMDLYGKGNGVFNGKTYAETGKDIEPIQRPNLNVLAFSTKAALVEALGQADAANGFLNRLLLATVPNDVAEQKQFGETDERVPVVLREFVRALANPDLRIIGDHPASWVEDGPNGALMGELKTALGREPQVYLHYAGDAELFLKELTNEANRLMNGSNELHAVLSQRVRQNVIAVAGVLAICELDAANPNAPRITAQHLMWAREFVLWSHRNWCALFDRNIAANAEQAAVNDLLDLIGRARDFGPGGRRRANYGSATHLDAVCAKGWLPYSLIGRVLAGIPKDLRAKALATLLETEQVVSTDVAALGIDGATGKAYRLA